MYTFIGTKCVEYLRCDTSLHKGQIMPQCTVEYKVTGRFPPFLHHQQTHQCQVKLFYKASWQHKINGNLKIVHLWKTKVTIHCDYTYFTVI